MAARERPSPFPPTSPSRSDAKAMDAGDPLALARNLFSLPPGVIALDGHRLGALPRATPARVQQMLRDEWGDGLSAAWDKHGWNQMAARIADKIAALIGAAPGTIRLGDRAALLAHLPAETTILDHVDPITSALRDRAPEAGTSVVWDVTRSVGLVPLDVTQAQIPAAIGGGEGFLCGGPGAPAFLYLAEAHAVQDVAPPSILALTALEIGIDSVRNFPIAALRAKSEALAEIFRLLVNTRAAELGLQLLSPVDPDSRGGEIAFRHAQADAIVTALAARGVIGEFQAPDIVRFGFAPLYVRHVDAWDAAAHLADTIVSLAPNRDTLLPGRD
jgi:kynureninase